MVASAYRRERGVSEIKRLCYAGLDSSSLIKQVVDRLQRIVPFEAYCAHPNDPLSGFLTQLISEGVLGTEEHRTYLNHVYLEEDWVEQRRMIRRRVSVARLSEVTGGKLERALHSREITLPLGLGHELLSVYASEAQQWGAICLIREHGRPDFDAREVALLQQITPHVSTGLKMAALRTNTFSSAPEDHVPGILILDDRGSVAEYTEAAGRWLQELGSVSPGRMEHGSLPTPVWMVMAALQKTLNPGTDQDLNGVSRIWVQTRSGYWLTLHAARTASQAGQPGRLIVVMEPCQPQELAWLRASAYGLSERERTVVELVVQGASTKEISKRLFISEYTVQEHLSNIFDKVGVRGRRALVKRLFLENIHSGLLGPSMQTQS